MCRKLCRGEWEGGLWAEPLTRLLSQWRSEQPPRPEPLNTPAPRRLFLVPVHWGWATLFILFRVLSRHWVL